MSLLTLALAHPMTVATPTSAKSMSRSVTFQSRTFGVDPMRLMEMEQNRQANKQKRAEKRPTLTLKSRKTDGEWSEARKAAEALFSPAADRS